MKLLRRNKNLLPLATTIVLTFLGSYYEVKNSLFNEVWGNYTQYEWGWPFGYLIDNQAVSGVGYWNIDDKFSVFILLVDFLIIYLILTGLSSFYSHRHRLIFW